MTTCQNCGSPVSIQSNFCGYCGSELFSYEIWNNVTQKMIPKLENHTYKIGVVREQKNDFIFDSKYWCCNHRTSC